MLSLLESLSSIHLFLKAGHGVVPARPAVPDLGDVAIFYHVS
jgi:hypothetical protein